MNQTANPAEGGPEKKSIPELDLQFWKKAMIKEIDSRLARQERTVVNLAGASASGKGEASEQLKQELEKAGKKVLVISTDNYYKGISQNIMEKVVARLDLAAGPLALHDLVEFTKKLIIDKKFEDKFSPENCQAIADHIKESQPEIDQELVKHLIAEEFSRIDFDTPDAVNLFELSEDINDLKNGRRAKIPDYSMKLSEPQPGREYDGRDYDVILVEGIYALTDQVAESADIKSFIEADPRTLILRRFRRDILAGRSMFPPEIDLWITLEIVLPAYRRHILPTKKNADLALRNDYTGGENFDTQFYDVQEKISISDEERQKLEAALGEPESVVIQEDDYFTSEESAGQVDQLIRVRAENGQLESLTHKGARLQRDDGKIIRPTEQFLGSEDFGTKYHDLSELRQAFRRAGFTVLAEMVKERKVFRQDEIEAVIDKIPGLGSFIELRANNKISRAAAIDDFKARHGLSGKKSRGPYIDEFLDALKFDAEAARQLEVLLNSDINKEVILGNHLCQSLETLEEVASALEILRQGYPDKPLSGQCQGEEFRTAAKAILDNLSRATLEDLDRSQTVVLMPWRSGLAFGQSYQDQEISQFYHLSSKRDEQSLRTIVDYENGEAGPENTVIIADPMLATGNTIVDAIERMLARGVEEKNIIINAVIAAPSGIAKIKKAYPLVKIVVGAVDEKLDHKGYIVPGLGDFGDKYFTDLSAGELDQLVDSFGLDKSGREKLIRRIKKQGVSEVLNALVARDLQDREIDAGNREDLSRQGLKIRTPKQVIKINTGVVEGVDNVVALIAKEAAPETRIVAVEGLSGTGKSSTAEKLAQELNALKFSLGEVFRYLAYCRKFKREPQAAIGNLSYRLIDGRLCLFDGETNITVELEKDLHDPELEALVPQTAAELQAPVIKFCGEQIARLAQAGGRKILIEGRAFTLDFLPGDLRVKLVADPSIRAERRWNQQFGK